VTISSTFNNVLGNTSSYRCSHAFL